MAQKICALVVKIVPERRGKRRTRLGSLIRVEGVLGLTEYLSTAGRQGRTASTVAKDIEFHLSCHWGYILDTRCRPDCWVSQPLRNQIKSNGRLSSNEQAASVQGRVLPRLNRLNI